MSADRAVEDLLRELAPQVLGMLIRRYGQFDACEDAVQEALLDAAAAWPGDPPTNPRGWLLRVATRRLTDNWRSDSARRRLALRPASHPGVTLRLPRAAAFWVVGATVAALLAASSAPSPLYPIYQQEFGFSALELTAIFAVYVLALLVSLLTVGRLSDFTGRRPVLAGALVVEAAAMAVFLAAEGTHWLLAARVVQGLATGAAIGVLGAC